MSIQKNVSGWLKDKRDPRDYLYVPRRIRIPDSVDLSKYLSDRDWDQGNEGSCTGFGFAVNLTATAILQGVDIEPFGPRWIYNGTRELEGRLYEEGAYPRDVCSFLLGQGINTKSVWGGLKEHFWPYVARQDMSRRATMHPNAAEAKKWSIKDYRRVVDRVDGLCAGLAERNFESVGMYWYDCWMDPKSDGILPVPSSSNKIVGGHEVCFYGYNIKTQMFSLANSWTKQWADHGRAYLPFEAIDKMSEYDAHILTCAWGTPSNGDVDGHFPVEKIKQVQLYDRRVDLSEPWRKLGDPYTQGDGTKPYYRGNVTYPEAGYWESYPQTMLMDARTFDGLVRRYNVVADNPPPPPPPEDLPEGIIQEPFEGEKFKAGEKKQFTVYIRKKPKV